MTRHAGLTLQRNTYFVRVVVPADVRRVLGKRELIQSLQTGDYAEAVRKWGPIYKAFKRQIEQARAKGAINAVDLQPARIALANWATLEGQKPVEDDDEADTPWRIQKRIADYEKAWTNPNGWEVIANYDEMAVEMLTAGGLPTRLGDPIIAPLRPEVAVHLMYAERHNERRRLIAAREKLVEAARGADLDHVGVMPERPSKALPVPSVSLQKLHNEWAATLKVSDKEKGRLAHQMRRLIEFVGDIPANHLTKDQIRDFMALVARFPGRKRPPQLNALPIRELVEVFERQNAERPAPAKWRVLTETTVGEWYGSYRRMFDHGIAMDRVDDNPFETLKAKFVVNGSASVDRRAFTDEEIKAIFTAPLFTGFEGDGKQGYRDRPGPTLLKDAKYWLPIIALFHGARLTELAAMPLTGFRSVKREGGGDIWYFDLTDRRVKTEQSQRLIPMHPHMVELGWVEHVAKLREAGEEWLFPDLLHDNPRGAGHEFSKWWGNWSNKNGFADPATTFHSWRHTWKRRARQSPVKEEMHDVISGHKGQTVSRGYGEGADIEPLARDMALITFPMFPKLPTVAAA